MGELNRAYGRVHVAELCVRPGEFKVQSVWETERDRMHPSSPKTRDWCVKTCKKIVGDFWKHPQKFDIVMS